jgi:MFS family permease
VPGVALVVVATARILPGGVIVARRGRPAGAMLMLVLTGVYFGAHAVVAITAHDLLGRGAGDLGLLLAVAGVGWAVAGLACGRWPAPHRSAFRLRVTFGTAALTLGAAAMAAAVLLRTEQGWPVLLAGWACTGIGMGLCYVDTLNRVLDTAPGDDGGAAAATAQALVMAEAVGTALAATATASALAWVVSTGAGPAPAAAVFALLGVLALLLVPLAGRT